MGAPVVLIGVLGLVVAAIVALLLVWHPWSPGATAGGGGRSGGGGGAPSGGYMLRLSGSNTIGSVLGPELVKAWLASKGATDISAEQLNGADGKPIPEYVIHATLQGKPVAVDVRAYGSATAFKDLGSSAADVGMASRPIKDDEAQSLSSLGNLRGLGAENVLALDGIAVVVPQTNAIASLSVAQLCQIFSGAVTDWSQVGGSAGPIRLYARDDNSGTFDAFKSIVLSRCGGALGPAKRYDDSAALEADVSRDTGGIGFIGMPYVKTTRAVPIGDGEAAPLLPTIFTVKTESYALSRRLFLYIAAQGGNPLAREFVNFAVSAAAWDTVTKAGFVNLNLAPATTPASLSSGLGPCRLSSQWHGDPNEYCALRTSAQQLQTSFHFLTGSSQLDNKAVPDLRQILDQMTRAPDKTIV
ncbi:MAG TPA: PstS family phosphate ABC transporter substrate-binding protein, partial [Burkholderiaceae bacterium]|nr:PstS family phosphate ABC transporter substrate-binding protein [Burkholderiaceae bacterium]